MAKVLLVEDDNNLREIYQARLTAEGYDIVTAQNGEEALVVAKQNKPDLIISDVMMPRISGFEMLDILRNTDELKHTKVIMLTALGQADDQKRANSLGADRYLVKSQVTLEDIVNAAKELLTEDGVIAPTPAPQGPASPSTVAPVISGATHVAQAPVAAAPATVAPTIVSAPVQVAPEPGAAPAPMTPPMPVPTPTPPVVPAPTSIPEPVPQPPIESPDPSLVPAPEPVTPPVAPIVTPVEPPAMPLAVGPLTTPETVPPAASATESESTQTASDTPTAPTTPADPGKVVDETAQGLEAEEAALQAQIASYSTSAPSADAAVATSNDQAIAEAVKELNNSSEPEEAPEEKSEPPETPATPPNNVTDNVTVAGKKIIQPISDPTAKPDLNALLAREEAKDVSVPTPSARRQSTAHSWDRTASTIIRSKHFAVKAT